MQTSLALVTCKQCIYTLNLAHLIYSPLGWKINVFQRVVSQLKTNKNFVFLIPDFGLLLGLKGTGIFSSEGLLKVYFPFITVFL